MKGPWLGATPGTMALHWAGTPGDSLESPGVANFIDAKTVTTGVTTTTAQRDGSGGRRTLEEGPGSMPVRVPARQPGTPSDLLGGEAMLRDGGCDYGARLTGGDGPLEVQAHGASNDYVQILRRATEGATWKLRSCNRDFDQAGLRAAEFEGAYRQARPCAQTSVDGSCGGLAKGPCDNSCSDASHGENENGEIRTHRSAKLESPSMTAVARRQSGGLIQKHQNNKHANACPQAVRPARPIRHGDQQCRLLGSAPESQEMHEKDEILVSVRLEGGQRVRFRAT